MSGLMMQADIEVDVRDVKYTEDENGQRPAAIKVRHSGWGH